MPSGAPIAHQQAVFPATLGAHERLLTYAVGYGVGLVMPLLMGVGFAAAFSQAWLLFLPAPFVAIFGVAYLLHPIAFTVSDAAIGVVRSLGTFEIPLRGLCSVRLNIRPSSVGGLGLARLAVSTGRSACSGTDDGEGFEFASRTPSTQLSSPSQTGDACS